MNGFGGEHIDAAYHGWHKAEEPLPGRPETAPCFQGPDAFAGQEVRDVRGNAGIG